jgi:hypothetical protein
MGELGHQVLKYIYLLKFKYQENLKKHVPIGCGRTMDKNLKEKNILIRGKVIMFLKYI